MKNQSTPNKKPAPLPLVILADVLLLAVSMSVFCYFHHIRSLWGIGQKDDVMEPVVTESVMTAETSEPSRQTHEGDFSFPGIFSENTPAVTLTDDGEIRDYLTGEGLPILSPSGAADFIGLYRSENIYLTAQKVSTTLHYNNKTYEVVYYLYDVYLKNLENLHTVAVTKRRPMEDLAEASYALTDGEGNRFFSLPAVLAVNGDYWGNEKHTLLALRNYEILRDTDEIAADVCVLYSDGTMETHSAADFDYEAVMQKKPYQIWEFGPSLLDKNGNALDEFNKTYYDENVISSRHPRSSIGYFEPGHYCFIVVDGRSEQSDGVRMFQLAQFYEDLGCSAAYNLDGGDSALSRFMGEYHRIDEERLLKGDDQRKLYDVICIGEIEWVEQEDETEGE